MSHNSSQYGEKNGSLPKTAGVELESGRVEAPGVWLDVPTDLCLSGVLGRSGHPTLGPEDPANVGGGYTMDGMAQFPRTCVWVMTRGAGRKCQHGGHDESLVPPYARQVVPPSPVQVGTSRILCSKRLAPRLEPIYDHLR